MPINFYLAITGLCVIVLKSQQDYPVTPKAVEILCVDAPHHRPALSYLPKDMNPTDPNTHIAPELCVGPRGERLAMLDLSKKLISFEFGNEPAKEFTLPWGDPAAVKPEEAKPWESNWMNWVTPAQHLGLDGIRVGKESYIPQGAATRVKLLPGTIIAQEIITDTGNKVIEWNFPAKPEKPRAMANQVLYFVKNADYVRVLANGKPVLVSTATKGDLFMSLSNDMMNVPPDYNQPYEELKHLTHLEELAEPFKKVQVPKAGGNSRTGRPICNQIIFVDKSQ